MSRRDLLALLAIVVFALSARGNTQSANPNAWTSAGAPTYPIAALSRS